MTWRWIAALPCMLVILCGLGATAADAFVYWTDGGDPATGIGRAGLDGSDVIPDYVAIDDPWAVGLAVDSGRLYWDAPGSSPEQSTISRVGIDGVGLQERFLPHSSPAIASDGQYVYWYNSARAAAGSPAISRAAIDGSAIEETFIPAPASDITIAGGFIYWADVGNNRIGRARLDGTDVRPSFVAHACEPTGVAVDAQHIYWSNTCGSIGRADIAGLGADEQFIDVPSGAWDIAVQDGKLYWATGFAIGRSDIDGTNIDRSFVSGLDWGYSVATDALTSTPSATALAASPTSAFYGAPMTLTAAVSADSPPKGNVAFSTDSVPGEDRVAVGADGRALHTPAVPIDVGATVTARYVGDAAHSSSIDTLMPGIQPAHTSTTLVAEPGSSPDELWLTATVANTSTAVVPFGSVQFTVDGGRFGDPVALDADGRASVVAGGLASGRHDLGASYRDDTAPTPDFVDSTAALTAPVGAPSTTTTTATTTPVRPPRPPRPVRPATPRPLPAPRVPAPRLLVAARSSVARGIMRVTVTCDCTGAVTLDKRGAIFGAKRFTLHGRTVVHVRLTRAGLARLRRNGHIRVRVIATFKRPSGAVSGRVATTVLVDRQARR